jgi:hypothetical protein
MLTVVKSDSTPTPAALAEPEITPPRVVGKVTQFAKARLRRCAGERTSLEEAYAAYKEWCASMGVAPAGARKFVHSFADVCDASGVDLREIGERAYCLDVKLAG